MEVTLNYNTDEAYAFQLVFSTGRDWVIFYKDDRMTIEAIKGHVSMANCLCGNEIDDFFKTASKPSQNRFMQSLLKTDTNILCRNMMHIERMELKSYFDALLKTCRSKVCDDSVRIVKYVGEDYPTRGLKNGMFYLLVREKDDSCIVLRDGRTAVSVSNKNLQFTV